MLRLAAALGLAVRHRRRLREVASALCQGHPPAHAQVGQGGRTRRLRQEEGIVKYAANSPSIHVP